MTSTRLSNEVAIITGAARGLGRVFAMRFAQEGAKLMIVDTDTEGLANTAKEVEGARGIVAMLKVDVSKEEDTLRMVDETIKKFGQISILVNNAAIYAGLQLKPFYEITPDEWDRSMAVNIKGAWLCAKAVFPQMKKQGKGKIINLSSVAAFKSLPGLAQYTVSKAGILGLTRVLARELGQYNICVNAVAPGGIHTEATASIFPQGYLEESAKKRALKHILQPGDVCGAVIFLASDESDYITGQTIIVDAGDWFH